MEDLRNRFRQSIFLVGLSRPLELTFSYRFLSSNLCVGGPGKFALAVAVLRKTSRILIPDFC